MQSPVLFLCLSSYTALRGEDMRNMEEITSLFPEKICKILQNASLDFDRLQEIRLRAERPLLIQYDGQEYFVTDMGALVKDMRWAYLVKSREIRETMETVGRYSLYAHEEELRQGFLTIQGGHRVGVAGKIILDGSRIRNVKYISFLNVRLSHQMKGCGDSVLPFLYREDGQVCHTLIISPPRCGKTTLLRDLIRQISDGWMEEPLWNMEGQGKTDSHTGKGRIYPGHTVGVVDERSEIAGSYLGVPSNDLGIRTDVLDCCPKVEGMMMLIRSMSPEVVAVDEIGNYEEIHAIETVLYCGCRLLATVHGSSMEDVRQKPLLQKLVQEQVFERYIILQNQVRVGQVRQILDQRGNVIC